ncbi:MAG: hypothetical protein AAGF73_09650 [Actinomycetota bacterium]
MLAIQFGSRQHVPLAMLAKGLALHDLTETFSDSMTVVEGDAVRHQLTATARALRWLRAEVVNG